MFADGHDQIFAASIESTDSRTCQFSFLTAYIQGKYRGSLVNTLQLIKKGQK